MAVQLIQMTQLNGGAQHLWIKMEIMLLAKTSTGIVASLAQFIEVILTYRV